MQGFFEQYFFLRKSVIKRKQKLSMSKHHLRIDKTCGNCGHQVPERYCTNCGQENIETRVSFGHLLRHFIEDLTHYESNFWKTIKYLLFRPSYLTREYLANKRVSFVAPVRLYLFISFLTFLLPGILPDFNKAYKKTGTTKTIGKSISDLGKSMQELDDSLQQEEMPVAIKNDKISISRDDDSVRKYIDSLQDGLQPSLNKAENTGLLESYFDKKTERFNHLSAEEQKRSLRESFSHNFPKALFLYMPMFAFVLWLFHSKKKWFYFDHAIFTLHYFSFLLLMITTLRVVEMLIPWHYVINVNTLGITTSFIAWAWSVFYFYRGQRKLHGEKKRISWVKSTIILFINSMLFIGLMIGLFVFAMTNVH